MFLQRKGREARTGGGARRKLYSAHGLLLDGRAFAGKFDAAGASYSWAFEPRRVEAEGGKITFEGRFIITPSRGAACSTEGLRATLAATQGAIVTSAARRELTRGTVTTGTVATPQQKQEQAKAPETAPQTAEAAPPKAPALPITEATGSLGLVGVMYLYLPPLNGCAPSIPLDLSRVQLNVRIAPTDDVARDLQILFTDLVEAVHGERPDAGAASRLVGQVNELLAG
jgi:hypothetical protein